jgi:hypothetical protein
LLSRFGARVRWQLVAYGRQSHTLGQRQRGDQFTDIVQQCLAQLGMEVSHLGRDSAAQLRKFQISDNMPFHEALLGIGWLATHTLSQDRLSLQARLALSHQTDRQSVVA